MKGLLRTVRIIPILCILLFGFVSSAYAFETPCIPAPYGWKYQNDHRSTIINKVAEKDYVYFVADVQLTQVNSFHTAFSDTLSPVSGFAAEAGAVLAINGDDFPTHKYGVIIRNGNLLRTHNTTRHLLVLVLMVT